MDCKAGLVAVIFPVEEHRIGHRLVPFAGEMIPIHASWVEFVVASRRSAVLARSVRRDFEFLASGGGGPVVKQSQIILRVLAQHVKPLGPRPFVSLADVEK